MNKLNHLAIIIDGNRRWAKQKGLTSFQGHLAGYKKIKQICDWCLESGIKFLTVYAFSHENWQRKQTEVSYLMRLTLKAFKYDIVGIHRKGFKLKVIGRLEKFSSAIRQAIQQAEDLTKNNTHGILVICLGYGGQLEIVDAVKRVIAQKIPAIKITPQVIQRNLYAADIPSPDLIIRTGGFQRLSNFLTWQSVYAELFFTKTLFPAFLRKNLIVFLKIITISSVNLVSKTTAAKF